MKNKSSNITFAVLLITSVSLATTLIWLRDEPSFEEYN